MTNQRKNSRTSLKKEQFSNQINFKTKVLNAKWYRYLDSEVSGALASESQLTQSSFKVEGTEQKEGDRKSRVWREDKGEQ